MDLDIGRKVCRTVAPAGEIRISDAKEVFPVMLFPWKKKNNVMQGVVTPAMMMRNSLMQGF